MSTRREHDLLGELDIPADAYYGIQTFRSMQNFHITENRISDFPDFIVGLAATKEAAAKANYDLDLLEKPLFEAIEKACQEIRVGELIDQFQVDVIQGGAGTSTNMNANEVIANRALEIMGYKKGEYEYCHPNNHINLSQSTNDAYPTGARIGICFSNKKLIEELKKLVSAFRAKAKDLGNNIKMGRTQLQDAVPITYEQEFEGYASSLEAEIKHFEEVEEKFHSVNMGATAIGTGINSDPDYPKKVVEHLAKITGLNLKLAENLIAATNDTTDFVSYSSQLKRLAVKISKISNDLRLLSSGPRAGIYEIRLPAVQPGSSIMPGKVNPVIPEAMNQIAFRVIGNDATITMASEAGQLELNVFEPVMIYAIFESVNILTNGMEMLRSLCVDGIEGNFTRARSFVYNSIGLVTALNPVLGYEASSQIAKQALAENRSVYDLVLEKDLLTKEELDEILEPQNMTRPRKLK
ncbi:MAG: aspartate ammonia-lyase [Treponema sp.]|nr:MAG: aspartate ammonia-lyase [Treponema sp.]